MSVIGMNLLPDTNFEDNLIDVDGLNDKHWVTKHNELIQSTYRLTLQQQRILLIIASRIQPSDENFKLYKFNTKDIIDILGLSKTSGSYYNQIRTIVNDLQTKTLTIKTNDRETNFTWVITSDYFPKLGYFQVELHPKLKPYFLELKDKFTKYRLENVLRLNSSYSIRMYELLKQYERIGTRKFGVDELKELLSIEPGKYKQFGHFKSKILIHSQEELKKHTDLSFDFNEIKSGRKITALEFHIKSKRTVIDIQNDDINSSLKELGISIAQIKKIRDEWDDDIILRNLIYTKEQLVNSKNPIKNPAGYFIQALSMDYSGTDASQKDRTNDNGIVDRLNGTGVDHKENKYGKSAIDFESTLLRARELQRELEVDEEIIQEKLKNEVVAYAIYQSEKHNRMIEPGMFSDLHLGSYIPTSKQASFFEDE